MGDAAEWEVFRKHGVDISDDGRFENLISRFTGEPPSGRKYTAAEKLRLYETPAWDGPTARHRPRKLIDDPTPVTDPLLRDNWAEAGQYSPDRHKRRHTSPAEYRRMMECDFSAVERNYLARMNPDQRKQLADEIRNAYAYEYDPLAEQAAEPKEQGNMDHQEAITLLQITQGATLFTATYMGGQQPSRDYTFKNCMGVHLAVGDLAVVQSRDTLALVKVTDTELSPLQLACPLAQLKHLVAKVDMDQLNGILERERKAAHELALSELHGRLDKLREQMPAGALQAASAMLTAPVRPAPMAPQWGDRVEPNYSTTHDVGRAAMPDPLQAQAEAAAAADNAPGKHRPLKNRAAYPVAGTDDDVTGD